MSEIAAALAMHWQQGWEPAQAIRYRQQAAEQALRHQAYREAVEHLSVALELLQGLPETPLRVQQEIPLQLMFAETQVGSQGFAAPAVGWAYAREYELCAQGGDGSLHLRARAGLRLFYLMRAGTVAGLGGGSGATWRGQRSPRAEFLMEAHRALGWSSTHWGNWSRPELTWSRA